MAITAGAALVSGAFTFGVAYSIGEQDRQDAAELRCRARAAQVADARASDLLAEIGDLIENSFSGEEPSPEDVAQFRAAKAALREANQERERSIAECSQ